MTEEKKENDKGIKVKRLWLFIVCYLCGGLCDWEDYVVRDGVVICGDWYPSIDHVIPVSKGGLHSWENVKLAHRKCNTRKGNHMPPWGL